MKNLRTPFISNISHQITANKPTKRRFQRNFNNYSKNKDFPRFSKTLFRDLIQKRKFRNLEHSTKMPKFKIYED